MIVASPIRGKSRGREEDVKITELALQYRKTKSNEDLRVAIGAFNGIIERIAIGLSGRWKDNPDLEDYISIGMYAVSTAIIDWDGSGSLKKYVAFEIRNKIVEYQRGDSKTSRNEWGLLSRLNEYRVSYFTKFGREPEQEELRMGLNMSSKTLSRLEISASLQSPEEIEIRNDSGRPMIRGEERGIKDYSEKPGDFFEWIFKKGGMNSREKLLIILYYCTGLSFEKVAQTLGLEQSRVSQIHRDIIRRLRENIGKEEAYSQLTN